MPPPTLPANIVPKRIAVAVGLCMLAFGGCADTSTTALPPLTPDARRLLTKEEQAKAINDMTVMKEQSRSDALREIEKR